jgi:hypothetical protein
VGEQQTLWDDPVAQSADAKTEPVEAWAMLSHDRVYRYTHGRSWGKSAYRHLFRPSGVTFIMLNPSTADATADDPTIRRCVGFAKRLGFETLTVVNLFALRATDPAELSKWIDPVGPENDACIRESCDPNACELVIPAWGAAQRRHFHRVNEVLRIVTDECHRKLSVLGTTKFGEPRHPLYLPKDAELRTWP